MAAATACRPVPMSLTPLHKAQFSSAKQVKAWKVSSRFVAAYRLCCNQAGALVIAHQGNFIRTQTWSCLSLSHVAVQTAYYGDKAVLGFKIYRMEAYGVLGCLQTT